MLKALPAKLFLFDFVTLWLLMWFYWLSANDEDDDDVIVLKSYCYASRLLMLRIVTATTVPNKTDIDNPGLLLSAI